MVEGLQAKLLLPSKCGQSSSSHHVSQRSWHDRVDLVARCCGVRVASAGIFSEGTITSLSTAHVRYGMIVALSYFGNGTKVVEFTESDFPYPYGNLHVRRYQVHRHSSRSS